MPLDDAKLCLIGHSIRKWDTLSESRDVCLEECKKRKKITFDSQGSWRLI